MSTELMERVDEILKKTEIPERHSFFQIEKFMIGKEPTAQAQLWAVSREIQARKEAIDQFNKDLEDSEDNLELFDIKIERLNRHLRRVLDDKDCNAQDQDLNIQELEINIRKTQREKDALVKSAQKVNRRRKAVIEELAYLVEGYSKIVDKYGEMKPMDDDDAQREMWNEKLLEEFNLRVILQRPLDPEFIKTVMCLHDEAPVKKHVTSLINNIQQKMIAEKRGNPNRPAIEAKPRVTGG